MEFPTAQSASSLAPATSTPQDDLPPRPSPSRRRDKPQLSCNLCRRRKTRCDRQQPCANCAVRGQACVYAENHMTSFLPKVSASDAPTLQDRLVQLESLVMKLGAGSRSEGSRGTEPQQQVRMGDVDSAIDDVSETGSMRVSASGNQYVGGDHWAAIMESIADLKDHFDREEQFKLAESPDGVAVEASQCDSSESGPRTRRALLLYGCRPASSRAMILSALPPKPAVDRYVSQYFNRLDLVASSSVHGPTFLRQYESFWANPYETSIMWIGLLFTMICLPIIASDVYHSPDGAEQEQQRLQVDLYREKVVQCLVMGEYTQGGSCALETLTNYVYMEFQIHTDADKDVWFLLGIEVNLAKRMGYHRDPRHFPKISPLEGEMRRRAWASVLLGDILISGQMGMPRMINDGEFDTEEPRNLNDSDLDGDLSELPPPRSEMENTTSLGIIARRRLLIALGTISDLTSALKPYSHAEAMRVDSILHKAGISVPPPLQMKPMASSVTDSPKIIMARLFLGHIFYKGQIMLHRRFLFAESTAADQNSLAYSRKTCLDAALGNLHIQHLLDEETCPGGQLHSMHWRVGSIMNHHFFTAAMILSSLLYREQTMGRKEEIVKALRISRTIWARKSQDSKEAKKASRAISIVLAKGGGPRFDSDFGFEDFPRSANGPESLSYQDSTVGDIGERLWVDDQQMQNHCQVYEQAGFTMDDYLQEMSLFQSGSERFSSDLNKTGYGGTDFDI